MSHATTPSESATECAARGADTPVDDLPPPTPTSPTSVAASLGPEPSADRVAAWRSDTVGCTTIWDPKGFVHFNSAGAALVTKKVLSTVTAHLELETVMGGYEAGDEVNEARAVYDSITRLINAHGPHEIALAESARVGWSMAVYGIDFKAGDVILTTGVEYGANYVAFMQLRDQKGVVIEQLPHTPDGSVDASRVEECLRSFGGRVKCVAVTHIPTHGGLVNPCYDIGAAVESYNRSTGALDDPSKRVLYVVDACQTVGQMPVDVQRMRCDVLSATSRKFLRGPRGVGFLYVREDALATLTPPTLDHYAAAWSSSEGYTLHPTARRFEKWESSVALRLGLGAAVEYALGIGLDKIWERVRWLARYMRARISGIRGLVHHDTGVGADRCGIVTFSLKGWPAAKLKDALQRRYRINTTVSTIGQARLDMEQRGLDDFNRASVHYYNTTEEIDFLVASLEELAAADPAAVHIPATPLTAPASLDSDRSVSPAVKAAVPIPVSCGRVIACDVGESPPDLPGNSLP